VATSPDVEVGASGTAALPVHAPLSHPTSPGAFEVSLANFSGPFDLLLSLIAKHKMDVTEIALAEVTDEFIAHLRAQSAWDLSQASEFLVIAATLLDLKAARLLPSGAVEDVEDLELFEARDLLFARLLQYRAFKEVAAHLAGLWQAQARSHPRSVALEPRLAALLPELVLSIGPDRLAVLAAATLAPKPGAPVVDLGHLHAPAVSVREQAVLLVDRLRRARSASFRTLTADARGPGVVVARFLARLELFKEGAVSFDQADALTELTVRWTGTEDGGIVVDDGYEGASATDTEETA
jgi:segregation and condensation protein A